MATEKSKTKEEIVAARNKAREDRKAAAMEKRREMFKEREKFMAMTRDEKRAYIKKAREDRFAERKAKIEARKSKKQEK